MTLPMAAVPARERLLARGAESLTERELIALVIRNGAKGVGALDLAAELLAGHGSLGDLPATRPEELASNTGIGVTKAAALVAAFELGRRARTNDEAPVLRSPADAAVLRHDGRAFALAHHHPGGDPEPSEADRRITHAVGKAARVVGLRFLGHVMVGSDGWREAR